MPEALRNPGFAGKIARLRGMSMRRRWIYSAVIAAMVSGGCDLRGRTPEEQAEVDARRKSQAMVSEAEWRLERSARNPDSVEFRDTRVGSGTYAGAQVVCGEMNGENGFGGMSGFRRFIMVDGKVPMLESVGGDVFDEAWREAGC